MTPKPLLTVDPGLGGTGWAYFTKRATVPARTGVLKAPRDKPWVYRARHLSMQFACVCKRARARVVVLEFTQMFGGAVSQAAARRGNLFQLTFLTGLLAAEAFRCGAVVELIKPQEWKGQMDKRTVNARIKRAIGETYKNHEADAVGIGLHLAGVL